MQAQAFDTRIGISEIGRNTLAAVVAGALGLTLIALGAALPWVVLFRGLQPESGFVLDGGKLAGIAIVSAVALLVAGRWGGSRLLRTLALVGAAAVTVDSLYVASRIAAYVADPGPGGPLTQPTAGPGAMVMAAGGALLLLAAWVAPLRAGRLAPALAPRLALAASLFLAGWIHILLTPEHLGEATVLGLGFLVAGVVQLALAGLALARPRDWVWYSVIAVNAALILVYVYAVLVGLPFMSDHADVGGLLIGSGEPIDLFGASTTVAQIAGLAFAFHQLGEPAAGRSQMVGVPEHGRR